MQKLTTCLWFQSEAEQAAEFYVSIFKDARVTDVMRYGEAGPGPAGDVMAVEFELHGRKFLSLNGRPEFPFSAATSFIVNCETQEEVDHYWDKLSAGGQTQQCGWLQDRFGVSWQITPTVLPGMLKDEDAAKAQRVMEAMMGMVKIDIATLRNAYAG